MEALATTGITASLVVMGLTMMMAMVGAIGGFGGAVIVVPVLVLLGWSPVEAAPLGMSMVAAASLAAVPRQARSELTNHRLGITMETPASLGAAAGAVLSVVISPDVLMTVLGIAAITAALAGGTRTGQRNRPVPGASLTELRDQPGRLASAYPDQNGEVVPYRAKRVPLGLGLMAGAGLIAGMTGSSGGYIKTPVMSEVMHVPVKVAASTAVFMVGITSAVALAVYASQGRLTAAIAPAVIGGLLGGRLGAALQPRLPAKAVRRVLSIALIVIGIVVLVQS